MPILRSRRLNGRLFALTLPSTGTQPGQVGSLAVGTVTASAIPVTYVAASGTAPITYIGYISLHAAGVWTRNSGTFSATGGMFTGLSAGTSYDLRIVATNSAGSSTTDLTAGITTATSIIAPSPVGGLVPATPTALTIPVTYTAANGTAPITYIGYTSPHAAGAWTQNGGTFSATGGTFTGLAAATRYDLRIVASNSAGSSTTDLTTGISTAQSATAPTQVGSFAAATPTAFTIPVTYTAALGTAPVAYVGYSSPHSANTWTQNSGSFSSTGGSYVGLSPTTSYDLRIIASNSAGSSTTELLIGTSTTSAPSFTGAANRYDIVPNKSVVASLSPVTITAYPNGKWSGETITPTAVSGNGTFSPTSFATPSGSSASVSFTYTPSVVGEHAIAATNSGALYNPYSAPLNVYSAGSGVARNIAVSIASGLDPQPRQFDTLLGVANGFSFSGAKGWGSVSINLSAIDGATDGLWIRLYDADSAGATTAVGSGTALNPTPVQVYGPVSTTGTKSLLLPASTYLYLADIATDPAFTNPVRIPQRFAVWLGMGLLGRSQEAGIAWWWCDTLAPTGETFNKVLTRPAIDYRYEPQNAGFYRQNGTAGGANNGDPGGPTSGAQAAGRLVAATMGVGLFMVGAMANGGGVDEFINRDGSFSLAFQFTVADAGIDKKFRWLWAASQDGWDNVNSAYPESYAEYHTRFIAGIDWVARNYPACAIQGWGAGGTGRPEPNGSAMAGINGPGSATPGAARLQDIFLSEVEPTNPMALSKDNHAWAAFKFGHGNQSSKRLYAQTGIRQLLSAELGINGGLQTQNRGPTLMSAGTIASGSRVIRLPGNLNGGGALQTVKISQSNPNYSVAFGQASASDLASLVAIYGPGGYSGNGQAIRITGVAINTSNLPSGADFTLDVTLAGSSGITYADGTTATFPAGFTAHYAADLNASGGTGYNVYDTSAEPPPTAFLNMITDSQVSAPWEWGRHVRPKLDIQISVV